MGVVGDPHVLRWGIEHRSTTYVLGQQPIRLGMVFLCIKIGNVLCHRFEMVSFRKFSRHPILPCFKIVYRFLYIKVIDIQSIKISFAMY